MRKIGIVLSLALVCLSQTICFASKTSTGFYYPLDSFTFSTPGTWLGPGNGSAGPNGHIGVDMLAPVDTRVRAISDGTVWSISQNGWDEDNNSTIDNIAVLVKHVRSDGSWFIALYGHVKKESAIKSGTIKAGDTIGYLGYYGNEPHLHFGVVDLGKNPIAPYGYSSSSNHDNFIDPIAFIKKYAPLNSYLEYRRVGNLAWYPANESCINAKRWIYFNLGYPDGGMSIGTNDICYSQLGFMADILGPNIWWSVIEGSDSLLQINACKAN